MDTIRLTQDFKEFLRLLNARSVEYLLIGGYAVSVHGYSRPTMDLDVWVGLSPTNVKKVVEALREFGFDMPELTEELFTNQFRVIRMGYPPFRIEVCAAISGVNFEECYSRRLETELDGEPVKVISLADLKANKRASGRYKDLADLDELP